MVYQEFLVQPVSAAKPLFECNFLLYLQFTSIRKSFCQVTTLFAFFLDIMCLCAAK